MLGVPLFVKRPGQGSGPVDDRTPTTAGMLDGRGCPGRGPALADRSRCWRRSGPAPGPGRRLDLPGSREGEPAVRGVRPLARLRGHRHALPRGPAAAGLASTRWAPTPTCSGAGRSPGPGFPAAVRLALPHPRPRPSLPPGARGLPAFGGGPLARPLRFPPPPAGGGDGVQGFGAPPGLSGATPSSLGAVAPPFPFGRGEVAILVFTVAAPPSASWWGDLSPSA